MITVQTIKEKRWADGKRFVYLDSVSALAVGQEHNIAFGIFGGAGVIVESITIESDAESIEWEAFAGVEVVSTGANEIKAIPRNSAAQTESACTVLDNPAIFTEGVSLSGAPIKLVAQTYRNNAYYLKEDLISSDFLFQSGGTYVLVIKNSSAAPADMQIIISIANE